MGDSRGQGQMKSRSGVGFDTVAPDCGAASESHESVVVLQERWGHDASWRDGV